MAHETSISTLTVAQAENARALKEAENRRDLAASMLAEAEKQVAILQEVDKNYAWTIKHLAGAK